jgi:subtilisin family serine protease
MKRITTFVALLSIVALTLFAAPMSGQNQQYPFPGYPPEFSPLRTSRPRRQNRPKPTTKFIRAENDGIANQYLVTLDDKAVPQAVSRKQLRRNVSTFANALVAPSGGKVGFIYENGPKGFSANMSESAAMALSQSPQVKLVEQDRLLHIQSTQTSAPWHLDRIDEIARTLQGNYIYNATGSGVVAYVLDTGIRATHNEFGGRASNAADLINQSGCTGTNNDCHTFSHGTAVASVLGGSTYGVSKGVTIKSVKVCTNIDCPTTAVTSGLNWIIGDHSDSDIAVANISIGNLFSQSINNWTQAAINDGITCVAAGGNQNANVSTSSPASVAEALTVGASEYFDSRLGISNYGAGLDIFAPGHGNVAACASSNSCVGEVGGTSGAAPIAAGLAALYLEGRTGMADCASSPIQGPSNTSGGAVSTCPDRVNQFIKSNATLSVLSDVPTGTANRLAYSGALPTNDNPIDNHRFFVWQQYTDFLGSEPDEGGLDHWTLDIIGHGHCTAGVNENTSCTNTWRINTSRAFWVYLHPELFNGSYGLNSGKNDDFVQLCYEYYLRREADTEGYNHWLGELNSYYGDPADAYGVLHLIDAFINSPEYRQRFGEP